MKLRIAELAGFPAAIAIGAGCGTVLVLADPPPGAGGPDGGTGEGGAPSEGGSVDGQAPTLGCTDDACRALGGVCVAGACRIDCGATVCPNDGIVECPRGTRCLLACGKDECVHLQCRGAGCTFECSGPNACKGASCAADECRFVCNAKDSCTEALHCDGGTCAADCTAEESCEAEKGIHFSATKTCEIVCSGEKSCTAGAKPVIDCGGSPTSKIDCAPLACKEGIPSCTPPPSGSCTIGCPAGACTLGVCCPAGGCTVTGSSPPPACP